MPVFIHMEIPGVSENGTDMEALARRVPECTFVALGGKSPRNELRASAYRPIDLAFPRGSRRR
jgi:hypothetical protein